MAAQHARHSQPDLEVAPVEGLNTAYDRTNEKYSLAPHTAVPVPIPIQQQRVPRICGRRKVTFWLMTALAVALVVAIAVAVIAGVEVSKRHTQQKGKQYAGLQRPAYHLSPILADPDIITEQSNPTVPSVPQSTSSALSSARTPSSTSSSTSSAPTATGNSITPALGASAPRDCPASNGNIFTATSPYDTGTTSTGSTTYEKSCNANVVATNRTNLASFVVNSFDLCIQICAGQGSQTPVSAVYHWRDGIGDPKDRQRPGTCWCVGGINPATVNADHEDTAIPKSL